MDWTEPWQGGRRGGGWLSPFYPSSDLWDYRDRGGGGGDDSSALAHAHVDWRETPTAHVFLADLPGVRKEEVKVQVEDNNILQISGERVKEEEDQSDKWHRVERRRGSFVRRFRLPENANLGDVKCSLENGVLRVVVPKIEDERSQKNVRYIDIV